jgi:nuclear transport factor 2 (NTF2) superfamily protein
MVPSKTRERTAGTSERRRYQWSGTHGNELWEFDEEGYVRRRDVSINGYRIEESERKIRWSR